MWSLSHTYNEAWNLRDSKIYCNSFRLSVVEFKFIRKVTSFLPDRNHIFKYRLIPKMKMKMYLRTISMMSFKLITQASHIRMKKHKSILNKSKAIQLNSTQREHISFRLIFLVHFDCCNKLTIQIVWLFISWGAIRSTIAPVWFFSFFLLVPPLVIRTLRYQTANPIIHKTKTDIYQLFSIGPRLLRPSAIGNSWKEWKMEKELGWISRLAMGQPFGW